MPVCDEGWRGRGNGASVLRIVPYSALHFSAYESYRQALADFFSRQAGVPEAEFHVTPAVDLLAGSAAGATAVLVRAAGVVHGFSPLVYRQPAQTPALPPDLNRAPCPAQITWTSLIPKPSHRSPTRWTWCARGWRMTWRAARRRCPQRLRRRARG